MKIFYSVLIFFFFNVCAFSQTIDPYKFIATLQFDNRYHDYFSTKQEQVFPNAFTFNTIQDGNEDGSADAEDACENSVKYAIGDSIYGTGRTGLIKRGPNDQRPVVYFHLSKCADYDVYEYWLYYADNDYKNDHEHDWEKYFVYVKGNVPLFVRLSHHQKFNLFAWDELLKDDGHIIIGVNGGSHAMEINIQDGVKIRYNGDISKKNGRLDFGDGTNSPWRIYTNDANVIAAVNYTQKPDCFFGGDPVYHGIPMLSSHKEYKKCNPAPWMRKEWNESPIPHQKSKMNMAITIGN
ncbi:MAG: hypothetical protein V4511_11140 [Bacteroidota bacterium]